MIRSFGDAALLVELASSDLAQSLAASLRAEPPPGMVEVVPGLASLLVELDPLAADDGRASDVIERRLAGLQPLRSSGRTHTIPVTYDGPDLDDVARLTGLAAAEVVARHASAELRVLFCGFAPGFAYLGDLPSELRVDRLATPRTRTPTGSVAIAGSMTGVYPADLPGGWRVIGRTEVALFDPTGDRPALLEPGDRVRFEPA
ncbi:MAG: 5-oxoprolinase (ATP-hydrolyzing) subunit [Chloroflexota bacterium]|nr:5-oxoprolinase (ATP-hydrolyzing) subunit [Chloroflexota bacterium]